MGMTVVNAMVVACIKIVTFDKNEDHNHLYLNMLIRCNRL